MDFTQYKIDAYAMGVSDLPDYPSDEGYTAAQLKAVFDARSNNEIKSKHNALADALTAQDEELRSKIISEISRLDAEVQTALDGKVDKEAGKGLSSNDYTSEEKQKLAGLQNYDDSALREELGKKVDAVEGKGLSSNDFTDDEIKRIGDALAGAEEAKTALSGHTADKENPHSVTAQQLGLGNVDNTPDADKPISRAAQLAIDDLRATLDALRATVEAHINNAGSETGDGGTGTSVDLSAYATKEYVDTSIQEAVLDSWEASI